MECVDCVWLSKERRRAERFSPHKLTKILLRHSPTVFLNCHFLTGLKISLGFFGWKNIGRSAELCCVLIRSGCVGSGPQDDLACLVYDLSLQQCRPELMSAGPGDKQITIVPTWASTCAHPVSYFCGTAQVIVKVAQTRGSRGRA